MESPRVPFWVLFYFSWMSNDMPGAINCSMLLYADDTCLVFQDKDLSSIKDKLNSNFNNLCDWFVDNKLSIHFGEDKTKSILFSGRNRPSMIS